MSMKAVKQTGGVMEEKKQSSHYIGAYRPKITKDLIPSSAKSLTLIEEKQTRIVDAACKLLFKKGFHRTSIREIADACGMSMGQLYHYIASKDDILFLVAKHMQELWYEDLVAIGLEENEDSLARMIRILRATIHFPAKHKKLFQFIFSESKYLDKEHLEIILRMDERNITGSLKNLLEEVNRDYPMACDLDLAARFLTFITQFVALRGWNIKPWPVEQTEEFMVGFILRGLGLPVPTEP